MKFRFALVILVAAFMSQAAHAQNLKWEVTPFVGWETSGSFPVQNSGTVDRIRADSDVTYGLFADRSLTENFQLEFMWNRNPTSFSEHDFISDTYTKAFDSNIDQYSFGILYHFRSPEKKLRPFIAAGLGFTHDGNSGVNSNQTNFSYDIGGGVKYYLSPHFGLRGDVRFDPTYANTSPQTFCDAFGDCFTANQRNYLDRANFTIGAIIRF